MTALQWIVKEAKEIKKKYPKRFSKWTEYVAQARAIYASKHKGKSPVGKKKPSIIKKAASKVKKLVKKAKDAYYEGYNEAARKSNPLMVKKRKVGATPKKKAVKRIYVTILGQKVLKGSALHKRLEYTKKHHSDLLKSEVSGVKKKKAVPKKSKPIKEQSILNKIHKVKDQVNQLDELQHKHMIGGTNNDVYVKMANLNNELIKSERGLRKWIKIKKSLVDAYGLPNYTTVLKKQKLYISELKKHKNELKKLI